MVMVSRFSCAARDDGRAVEDAKRTMRTVLLRGCENAEK